MSLSDVSNKRTVIQCQGVSKYYLQGKEKVVVLNDISFAITQGESVAIVGASGAGKSTLLNLLGGLDDCSSGTVELIGKNLEDLSQKQMAKMRNEEIGFVYQFHHLLSEFTALENTAMPLLIRGLKRKDAYQQATTMLDKVGLSSRITHRPSQLSGGERQRVAIARALVTKPSCVLMDEPTGNLDEKTAEHIQQLLQSLNSELSISFILVTHDMRIAHQQQRILQLHEGQLTQIESKSNEHA